MRCFQTRLPAVVFTDNDTNFSAALATIQNPPDHLLCLWHLVDQGIKKHFASLLSGGAANFGAFRKDFMLVRDVAEVAVAERLWSELLQAYFPDPVRQKNALDYMKLVYNWRSKWWISLNLDAPTMGMLSTQRSEGWHAIVKAVTSVYMPLESFVTEVEMYISQIDGKCQRRAEDRPTVSEFDFIKAVIGSKAATYLDEVPISARACEILDTEAKSSKTISVYDGNGAGTFRGNELSVTACYLEFLELKAGLGTPESELMRHYSRPTVTLRAKLDGINCACSCNFPQRMGLPCRHALARVRFLDGHLLAFASGGDSSIEIQEDMAFNDKGYTLRKKLQAYLDFVAPGHDRDGDGLGHRVGSGLGGTDSVLNGPALMFLTIQGSVRSRWFHLRRHIIKTVRNNAQNSSEGQSHREPGQSLQESDHDSRLLSEEEQHYLWEGGCDGTVPSHPPT